MSDEYVRVFCTAENPPTIEKILNDLEIEGVNLKLPSFTEADLNSVNWGTAYFIYEMAKPPFGAELMLPNHEFQWVVEDFIEAIKDSKKDSWAGEKFCSISKQPAFISRSIFRQIYRKASFERLADFFLISSSTMAEWSRPTKKGF